MADLVQAFGPQNIPVKFVDNGDGTFSFSVSSTLGGGGGGGLTNTELRATPVPVSGTITANIGTVATLATAALQTSGNASLTSIDAKLPSSGGHLSAQTPATGTNYTAFGSRVCKQLTVSNQTGTKLEFRQGAAGVAFQVPDGAFYTFFGLTDASNIDVRRSDTSNTQVTLTARWEA